MDLGSLPGKPLVIAETRDHDVPTVLGERRAEIAPETLEPDAVLSPDGQVPHTRHVV